MQNLLPRLLVKYQQNKMQRKCCKSDEEEKKNINLLLRKMEAIISSNLVFREIRALNISNFTGGQFIANF